MNLLLEIGAEEIPDWMLPGALQYLGGAVGEPVDLGLDESKLAAPIDEPGRGDLVDLAA